MSLEKAIKHGKEHRKLWEKVGQYAKSVDRTCRNHGGRYNGYQCPYCLGNRIAKNESKKKSANDEILKFKKGGE